MDNPTFFFYNMNIIVILRPHAGGEDLTKYKQPVRRMIPSARTLRKGAVPLLLCDYGREKMW